MMINTQTRVAILEDEQLTLDALRHLLVSNGLSVVVEATEPDAFLLALKTTQPSIALIDLFLSRRTGEGSDGSMPPAGLEVIRELHRRHPEIGVIAISGRAGEAELVGAREAGASVSLDKNAIGTEQLLAAIRAALRGTGEPFAAGRQVAVNALSRLTERELQVLRHLSIGADNLKIAAELGITERTVRAHVSALYRKLQCENRTQMAVLARTLGVRTPDLER